ncbi:Bromodomain [Dillenia turbinata]|uniref:Bromodomain n=1 Tax=Dillenia turbinata TaxID=194707 RepID=A0AAN8W0B3_9MAGN
MGKVAEMKKGRKKGRPSLLDLQKRSLKQQKQQELQLQQQQQQILLQNNNRDSNPNSKTPIRRSSRRNPNSTGISPSSDFIYGDDAFDDDDGGYDDTNDDDDDERTERKVKLVVKLPSDHQLPRSSSIVIHENLPKIDGFNVGSVQLDEKAAKATDTEHETKLESGPTTTLPDKKLLLFILDRLQKKDTYGVFSDTVDPEELPDYHDIIEHPMDFGTIRKKLESGAYSSLEQFEEDVFLICSNAMQYNSPDTIYFRQAKSIQELAKKDFDNLRQDSDDSEPQTQPKVVRRGRPPGKGLKKSLGSPQVERVQISSGATLANSGAGDNGNGTSSNNYNLRRVAPYKFQPAEFVKAPHGSRNGETHVGWLSDRNSEFSASTLKGLATKYGKRLSSIDDNRRNTYFQSQSASGPEASFLMTLGDLKHLIPVGLHSEYGYARSLGRFAANLGPAVWEIASRKIESALPRGVAFGPGWVGEKEAQPNQLSPLSDHQKPLQRLASDHHVSRPQVPPPGSNSRVANLASLHHPDDKIESTIRQNSQYELNLLNHSGIGMEVGSQTQNGMNGFSGGFGFNPSSQMGVGLQTSASSGGALASSQMLGSSSHVSDGKYSWGAIRLQPPVNQLTSNCGPESFGVPPSVRVGELPFGQGLSSYQMQGTIPPDLNVRFQSSESTYTGVTIGSPQQPDLALQL